MKGLESRAKKQSKLNVLSIIERSSKKRGYEILMINHNYRGLAFPGGGIEKNETPYLAAVREGFEETNAIAQPYLQLEAKGNLKYVILKYLKGKVAPPKQGKESNEIVWAGWVSAATILQMNYKKRIRPLNKPLKKHIAIKLLTHIKKGHIN